MDTPRNPWARVYSKDAGAELLSYSFDHRALAAKRLDYERLDQLTMEILLGVR